MSVVIIIAAVIIIILIVVFLLARKAGQQSLGPKTSSSSLQLTEEQAEDLKNAGSLLTNVRMTLARISDASVRDAGNEACSSIEKVLKALKDKPEKIQTNRQLFNYYLPTLDKVVAKFQRIEESKVDNKEMPEKICNYLSDVKEAMDNLYEGLYDNDKLHVAVDIEAMTIAVKRDGLLDEEDFNQQVNSQGQGSFINDQTPI